MKTVVGLFVLMAVFHGNAFAGARGGNGGDPCEDRFLEIRDKVAGWINDGGSKELNLPDNVLLDRYNTDMLKEIKDAHVSCTDDKVYVGKDEKTCKNFSDDDGNSQILCNRNDLKGSDDSELYVLVHHEYAGLANLEANESDQSQYTISNQLTAFYEAKVVLGLALIRQPPQPPNNVRVNFKDFIGQYDVVDCHEQLNEERGHKATSCDFLQADIFFGDDYQPKEGYDDLYLMLSKTATDPGNWSGLGLANNENAVGDVCSTFYGTQFCDRDFHGIISNVTVRQEGDFVRLEFAFSWPLERKNYLYRNLSLVLKKSDRPPFSIWPKK